MDGNKEATQKTEEKTNSGEYALSRSTRSRVIAAVVCAVLAVAVWLVVMNLNDTDYLALDTSSVPANCTVSVNELEVSGRICDLRNAGKIKLHGDLHDLPAGTYQLGENAFVLPEGVELKDFPAVTLTVTND